MKKSCVPQDSRGRFVSRSKCPSCKQVVCVCRDKAGRLKNCDGPARFCFKAKKDLVKSFVEANPQVMERCTRDSSGVEFESINHKYGRKGWRKVTTCEQAVRAVTPSRGPFCFDAIDLKTLNEIDAAKGRGFRLPPSAVGRMTDREAEEHYRGRGDDDDVPF